MLLRREPAIEREPQQPGDLRAPVAASPRRPTGVAPLPQQVPCVPAVAHHVRSESPKCQLSTQARPRTGCQPRSQPSPGSEDNSPARMGIPSSIAVEVSLHAQAGDQGNTGGARILQTWSPTGVAVHVGLQCAVVAGHVSLNGPRRRQPRVDERRPVLDDLRRRTPIASDSSPTCSGHRSCAGPADAIRGGRRSLSVPQEGEDFAHLDLNWC